MSNRGRPSKYTQEIADEICSRLADCESLNDICSDDGMPHESTVRSWVIDNKEGFSTKYARARNIGLDIRAERVKDAFMSEPDSARARLIFDHERWYLSKLAPKTYGDRTMTEITGKDGGAIQIAQKTLHFDVMSLPLEQREALKLALLSAEEPETIEQEAME